MGLWKKKSGPSKFELKSQANAEVRKTIINTQNELLSNLIHHEIEGAHGSIEQTCKKAHEVMCNTEISFVDYEKKVGGLVEDILNNPESVYQQEYVESAYENLLYAYKYKGVPHKRMLDKNTIKTVRIVDKKGKEQEVNKSSINTYISTITHTGIEEFENTN